LAIKPDTLSSSVDIYFIKLQDLLALSKAIFADTSLKINGLRGPKSLTSIQHIDKKDEEAKKLRSRTYWREMKPDHDPTTHQHAQAGSQQK
jgi:hypothetical protein